MFRILIILITLAACTQSPLEECFLSTGPIQTKTISLAKSPVAITVYDNLNVTWHKSESFYINLRCGRNLHNKIEVLLDGVKLELRNKARCNWVRDYSKTMQIDLYCNSLSAIVLNGYGDFISADTIKSDLLILRQYGACNSKLLMNVGFLNFDFNSYGTSKLNGTAKSAYLVTLKEGKLDPSNLQVGTLELKVRGINEINVWAIDTLKGKIESSGKVRYKGKPVIKLESPNSNQVSPQ